MLDCSNILSGTALTFGVFLLLLFGFAFSWIFALIGLYSTTAENAQQFGFIVVFPLTFISSAFVPVENMPAPPLKCCISPVTERVPSG